MSDFPFTLAVATKDGRAISEHFGHARQFWIYEVSPEGCHLREKREVDHYCHGHHGSATAMERILQTIADCRAVFVAKIGDGPADRLAAIGVHAVAEYAWEGIEAALLDYARADLHRATPT